MLKRIIPIFIISLNLFAISPISHFDRVVQKDFNVKYTLQNGKFSFVANKLINMDNIYYQGSIDNFDDAYIQDILLSQIPFKTIQGKSDKTIHIVFNTKINDDNSIKGFDTTLLKDENLTMKFYIFDKTKLSLPFNLEVYPFYVINDRFVQGGNLTKKSLKRLISVSNYQNKPTISIEKLKAKIAKKFNLTDEKVDIKYNETKKLFEVYKKGDDEINSYISSDGRYIVKVK
jgi:hypothetical protein